MKMTSSAMRTHTAEFKIIKARINPEPYFFLPRSEDSHRGGGAIR